MKHFYFTFTNIIKTKMLRNLLIMTALIAGTLTAYSRLVIMPSFISELEENTVTDARIFTKHLASEIHFPRNSANLDLDSQDTLESALRTFNIESLQLTSPKGLILYSTKSHKQGDFDQMIATTSYAALLQSSSEQFNQSGKIIRYLTQVQLPVIEHGVMKGICKVTYDITFRRTRLKALMHDSSAVIYGIATALMGFSFLILLTASQAMLEEHNAKENLQESHGQLEMRVCEQTEEIRLTQRMSIEALAILSEYYDPDTGQHLSRIEKYVVCLAKWLRDNSEYGEYLRCHAGYTNDLALAAVLHDIGKVAVPHEILTKPGKLTVEEFEIMKTHTQIGGEVLGRANQIFVDQFGKDSYLALARDIALYHHERWDGHGYSKTLKGNKIPLSARILSVTDVYDALRSKRPYKQPWTHEDTAIDIISNSGKMFDPIIVRAFQECSEQFKDIFEQESDLILNSVEANTSSTKVHEEDLEFDFETAFETS